MAHGLSPVRVLVRAHWPAWISPVRGAPVAARPLRSHCSEARTRRILRAGLPGFALRRSSGNPGYSTGDSVNRSHAFAQGPSRLPSSSAPTSSPSLSGSNLRSALQRDLKAAHRPLFHPELTASGSLSHSRRSFAGSSEKSLSKSSASRCLPFSRSTEVVASSASPHQAWRAGWSHHALHRDPIRLPPRRGTLLPSSPCRSSASSKHPGTATRPEA